MNHFIKRFQCFLTVYWMPIIVVGVTCSLYIRTYFFDFTNWDDSVFVRDNRLIKSFTLSNLCQLLQPGGIQDELLYIPVTYFTYLLESVTNGGEPGIFHLTNTFLHACNGVLVFYVVTRWAENRVIGAVTALLFSVHPLQVETVAWIMGRKDLLATFFSLITILAYQKLFESEDRRWYLVVISVFICAVLSKPTVIILPAILAIIAVFRNYRLRAMDFTCLFVMICISIMIYRVNHTLGVPDEGFPLIGRVLFQCAYIPSIFSGWITRLFLISSPNIFYSSSLLMTAENIGIQHCIPVLSILSLLAWSVVKRVIVVWFGLLFSLIAFLPSLTLIVYGNREFFTADRYGYFPLISVFFVISYPLKWRSNAFRTVYIMVLSIWLLLCVGTTYRHMPIWRNSETLWRFALRLDPTNPIAHNLLGNYYLVKERSSDAIYQYSAAILSQPSYAKGYYNLGRAYSVLKQPEMAVKYYQRALKAKPNYIDAYYNLGIVYLNMNSLQNAMKAFCSVTVLDLTHIDALYCIGLIHKKNGDLENALNTFRQLLRRTPEHANAYFQSAIVYHKTGRSHQAIESYKQSLRYKPLNHKAHYNLALIYMSSGRYDEGIDNLLAAEKIEPDDPEIHNKLGALWLEKKEYEKSVNAFSRALRLNPNIEEGRKNLATALLKMDRVEHDGIPDVQEAEK